MSFNVGDAVSYKGQSASKVTVAEIGSGFYKGYVRVQNDFQTGAKGSWERVSALVPYGADTGRESGGVTKILRNPSGVGYTPRS